MSGASEWPSRSIGEVTADTSHIEHFRRRATIDLDGSILCIEVLNNARTMVEGMFRFQMQIQINIFIDCYLFHIMNAY